MKFLLSLSRAIDAVNRRVGAIAIWFVLAAVLISTANAVIRKVFNVSSNAYLEVQWYLFSAVFLLCAGYVLLRNEHVRIDVFIARMSRRKQIWVDIFGLVVFLLPAACLIVWLSWPLFVKAYVSGEMSQNAGGLVRWPAYALLPIGFSLLVVQAISELIKRIAWLRGLIEDPALTKRSKTAEEELAESILAEAEAARK
jgi:TRAP-type mannitol/chloroaromatic compound transport system permease small subunit